MTTYIKAGFGFNVGYDFARATVDTPLEIDERHPFPRKGYVYGWIKGNPYSNLGFLRPALVSVCVRKDGVGGLEELAQ